MVLALSATGCTTLPGEYQVKQFLGLEQTFPHYDVPAPPTSAAYVLQLGMGQTRRIIVRAQPGAQQYEVSDPLTIQAVLGVLRAGSLATVPASLQNPQAPVQLDFVIGSPERTVTAHYNPANQTLQLYNVSTPAWPDHAVGAYTVSPAFGAALLEALQIRTPSPAR